MRTKYAVTFALLAAVSAAVGAFHIQWILFRAIYFWTAASFAWVAIAYASNSPRSLGKNEDGSRPVWMLALLGPYFALARIALAWYALTHKKDPPIAEVEPGLWFGRIHKLAAPSPNTPSWIGELDLAAEFERAVPSAQSYLSLATMDGIAPAESDVMAGLSWIRNQLQNGPVFVHCALGHGRTGTAIVAWLIASGKFDSATEAIRYLRQLRPGFGMTSDQIERAEQSVHEWRKKQLPPGDGTV